MANPQTEARRELEVARARYADLFDFAPIGYAFLDRHGVLRDINLAGERLFHTDRNHLLKAPLTLLFAKTDRRRWLDHLRSMRNTQAPPGSIKLELAKKNADQPVILEIRAKRVHSSVAYPQFTDALRLAIVDASAQHFAEQNLRRNESRFRALLEHATETITVLDAAGIIDYQSQNVTALLGHNASEMLGRRFFEFLHPDDLAIARKSLKALLGRPGAVRIVEMRVRHRDGSWRWLESIGTNQMADPAVGGVVLNSRDITARKAAEQQLTADLDTMVRLQKLGSRFVRNGNLKPILEEIIETAIIIANADFGSIQLLDHNSGDLTIAAHRALPPWWVDYWNTVSTGQGACGTALQRGARVIVEDVEQSPIFAGKPALAVQLKAGVRAVQSTPLMSRSGQPLGMFSTHYRARHRPNARALALLDLLARQAADIIEKWEADNELRAKEAQLVAITDITPVMLARCSRDLRYVYINRAYAAMLGATPERIVGRKIVDIMGEKGFATIRPRVEQVLRGEPVEYEDKVHYVLTGKSRWVHVVYVPERDQRRQVIGWIASIMDVTDLRHADEKLLESEERLAAMISSAMDAIISVNEKQKVVLFNAAAEKVFGCPAAKAIGRPLDRFFPKHVHKMHAQLIQHFDQSGMTARRMGAPGNISALRADGTEFPVEASISQTATREGKLFTIILRDVTERREAERVVRNMNLALESRVIERTRQLTAVNQRLQAIMDRAQLGIIVFNSNGAIALANPAAQEIFGYAAGEMTGLKISRLLPLPARPGRTRALFRSSPQDPAKFTAGLREVQGQRKDRTAIDLDVSLTESIQNGQWQCVAMMNDITERKRLERELIEAGEHERERLGHELHDSLGQQLHGISYLFSLLRAEVKKELPARAREVGRISRHLNHALELSRGLARGLQPVSPVPEGLMQTLKEMARRTREMFRVDCRFVCRAPVLIHRHNVASHLYRIAQEAVNNAIKHGEATRISVQLAATPQRITLVIRNNGRTFQRSSHHKKPGLGLHIMRHRTDAMRGSFQLNPLRSGGMEVICTVPRPVLNFLEDPEHES